MVPLGNVLTVIGCLGALVMVPHFVMPKKMVQLFIEKFPIDKEGTAAKQLELSHMGLFSQLFFLAVLLAIVGQTCPCLPAARTRVTPPRPTRPQPTNERRCHQALEGQ